MYSVGNLVMYGIHGACRITDLEERSVDHKRVSYFVLEPLEGSGAKFLIPTHNETALAKLRPILSREELDTLLHSAEVHQGVWIQDENQRKQRYRELINSGDRVALLQMVSTLHAHRERQAAAGRKFHLCDDNFLRDAQRLLSAEFSLVLGLDTVQTEKYVLEALNKE